MYTSSRSRQVSLLKIAQAPALENELQIAMLQLDLRCFDFESSFFSAQSFSDS